MTINVLIIDDEIKSREGLAAVIEEFCPDVRVVGTADSIKGGLKLMYSHKPDALFLDIEMNSENGFELLEGIDKIGIETIIVSAHSKYALKAIKFAVLDFLLKPVMIDELRLAIEKVRSKITLAAQTSVKKEKTDLKKQKISLSTSNGYFFAEIESISHCEADGSYTHFYFTDHKKMTVCKPLVTYEQEFAESNFFRIHKSYLVNLKQVQYYIKGEGGFVRMKNDAELPVSRELKYKLLSQLSVVSS